MNCPNKRILKSFSIKVLSELPVNKLIEQPNEGVMIVTKQDSSFDVKLVTNPVLWYSGGSYIKVDPENKWYGNFCWCRPTSMVYWKFNIENLKYDSNAFNSSKTMKWVRFYDRAPEFNRKDLLDVLFEVLRNNKWLEFRNIQINIKQSNVEGIRFVINTRSLVFATKTSLIPIKFDSNKIEINGVFKATTSKNKTEYAVINWFRLTSKSLNVQYDVNNNLQKYLEVEDLNSICNNKDVVSILVKITEIKNLEWNFPYSVGILSKSISQYNIEVIQNWDTYEMHDLVQNIKQIPRNVNLKIMKYFKIDHWTLDKSINEFWKVILEFNDVIFERKNYNNKIIIIGTTDEYDFENIHKNIFKIKIDGKIEIASFKVLLILICN